MNGLLRWEAKQGRGSEGYEVEREGGRERGERTMRIDMRRAQFRIPTLMTGLCLCECLAQGAAFAFDSMQFSLLPALLRSLNRISKSGKLQGRS